MKNKVLGWWSGGVASALAVYYALQIFKNVEIIFIDTKNEHPDTYRFLNDCAKLYGQDIKIISNPKYNSIEEVWFMKKSLNVATGAICSTELKRNVREEYQNLKTDYAQIFGFDITERKRHINMRNNYPDLNVISPLIDYNMTKSQVIATFKDFDVDLPIPYKLGYRNNNCFQTGCVQGGIGYWQKIKREEPEKFKAMADREHALTNLKGQPVTMLKDRTEGKKGDRLFLLPHPDYPNLKDISMMKGREPEPLLECTGFCKTK